MASIPKMNRIEPWSQRSRCLVWLKSVSPRTVTLRKPPRVALGEATAEVPGCGGVGDALGPEGVEVDLVVAADFEMFEAATPGQEVVGDVQDVIALVIRQVPLEQVEILVDVPDEPES